MNTSADPCIICTRMFVCVLSATAFVVLPSEASPVQRSRAGSSANVERSSGAERARTMIINGLSMKYPLILHGLSMDYPLIIHGLSMDYPWIIHGLSLHIYSFFLLTAGSARLDSINLWEI